MLLYSLDNTGATTATGRQGTVSSSFFARFFRICVVGWPTTYYNHPELARKWVPAWWGWRHSWFQFHKSANCSLSWCMLRKGQSSRADLHLRTTYLHSRRQLIRPLQRADTGNLHCSKCFYVSKVFEVRVIVWYCEMICVYIIHGFCKVTSVSRVVSTSRKKIALLPCKHWLPQHIISHLLS